jgi:hypothetical protein
MASWRITLDREQFRELVAGREITTEAGPDTLIVKLDLDYRGGMQRYTDPPEAAEFYTRGKRRPEPDEAVDNWLERKGLRRL